LTTHTTVLQAAEPLNASFRTCRIPTGQGGFGKTATRCAAAAFCPRSLLKPFYTVASTLTLLPFLPALPQPPSTGRRRKNIPFPCLSFFFRFATHWPSHPFCWPLPHLLSVWPLSTLRYHRTDNAGPGTNERRRTYQHLLHPAFLSIDNAATLGTRGHTPPNTCRDASCQHAKFTTALATSFPATPHHNARDTSSTEHLSLTSCRQAGLPPPNTPA